jgi:hypothetical protein
MSGCGPAIRFASNVTVLPTSIFNSEGSGLWSGSSHHGATIAEVTFHVPM